MINFMLRWVKHEKSFITSGYGLEMEIGASRSDGGFPTQLELFFSFNPLNNYNNPSESAKKHALFDE